jgi:hypothetical protein
MVDNIIGRVGRAGRLIEEPDFVIFRDVIGVALEGEARRNGIEHGLADVLDVRHRLDRAVVEVEIVRPHPVGDAVDGHRTIGRDETAILPGER